jgi:hypothetical protein
VGLLDLPEILGEIPHLTFHVVDFLTRYRRAIISAIMGFVHFSSCVSVSSILVCSTTPRQQGVTSPTSLLSQVNVGQPDRHRTRGRFTWFAPRGDSVDARPAQRLADELESSDPIARNTVTTPLRPVPRALRDTAADLARLRNAGDLCERPGHGPAPARSSSAAKRRSRPQTYAQN